MKPVSGSTSEEGLALLGGAGIDVGDLSASQALTNATAQKSRAVR
jgi:hypothetical protein